MMLTVFRFYSTKDLRRQPTRRKVTCHAVLMIVGVSQNGPNMSHNGGFFGPRVGITGMEHMDRARYNPPKHSHPPRAGTRVR